MLKKAFIVAIIIILFSSIPAQALRTPQVRENRGTIDAYIANYGLKIGGDYGINSQWAFLADFGTDMIRLGGKYQFQSELALLLGLNHESPFFGINGSKRLNPNLIGVYEFNLSAPKQNPSLFYNLGFLIDIEQEVDLRTGISGSLESGNFPYLQLGIGYQF